MRRLRRSVWSVVLAAVLTAAFLFPTRAHAAPLDTWESALDRVTTRRADILVLGDSISEGNGTGYPAVESWPSVLGAMMPRATGGGRGGPGYIPAVYAWGTANSAWTLAGGPVPCVSGSCYRGLGRRSLNIGNGQSASFSWRGDRLALYFTKTPTSGVMGVSIDGGTPAQISTTADPETNSARYVPATLPRGWHTVTVTRISGGPVHLEGGAFWDGDIGSGVTIWNGSHSGINTEFLIGSANEERWTAMIDNIGPDLVVIGLGTNDASALEVPGVYTPDIFGQRITTLIELVREHAAPAEPSFVLLQQPGSPHIDPEYWARHMDALADVAEAEGAYLLDLRPAIPQGPSSGSSALYTDPLHPNPAGARAYAVAVAQHIQGG